MDCLSFSRQSPNHNNCWTNGMKIYSWREWISSKIAEPSPATPFPSFWNQSKSQPKGGRVRNLSWSSSLNSKKRLLPMVRIRRETLTTGVIETFTRTDSHTPLTESTRTSINRANQPFQGTPTSATPGNPGSQGQLIPRQTPSSTITNSKN